MYTNQVQSFVWNYRGNLQKMVHLLLANVAKLFPSLVACSTKCYVSSYKPLTKHLITIIYIIKYIGNHQLMYILNLTIIISDI